MDINVKKQLSEALKQYATDKGLSQEQLAQASGLNVSYINAILKGDIKIGKTGIKESYFKVIAKLVGINLEKEYVPHIDTLQFNQIYTELLDAKSNGRVKMILSPTGVGKTYAVDKFLKDQPSDSYKITLSSLYRLPDVLNDLCQMFNVDMSRAFSHKTRLRAVTSRLQMKKINGGSPCIIFDEAENANPATLKMLKAFYDEASPYCSISLIGTQQLMAKLERMRIKDVEGMSQFYRRWKAGIREVSLIEKSRDFAPFLELVEDKNLRVLLTSLADNYGELTAYIGYSLKEADRLNLPLTEQLFKELHGMNN